MFIEILSVVFQQLEIKRYNVYTEKGERVERDNVYTINV